MIHGPSTWIIDWWSLWLYEKIEKNVWVWVPPISNDDHPKSLPTKFYWNTQLISNFQSSDFSEDSALSHHHHCKFGIFSATENIIKSAQTQLVMIHSDSFILLSGLDSRLPTPDSDLIHREDLLEKNLPFLVMSNVKSRYHLQTITKQNGLRLLVPEGPVGSSGRVVATNNWFKLVHWDEVEAECCDY